MKREMEASVPPTVWSVRLDSRRRPTFPEAVMKAAGLEPGSELRIHVAEQGCIVIETPEHVRLRAKSRIKTRGSGHEVKDFLTERAAESKLV
jgi:bifunctional DNA-binding transcriptional regulator/antitoxin component of YhaV-PrlF toxin-antitoxin module